MILLMEKKIYRGVSLLFLALAIIGSILFLFFVISWNILPDCGKPNNLAVICFGLQDKGFWLNLALSIQSFLLVLDIICWLIFYFLRRKANQLQN